MLRVFAEYQPFPFPLAPGEKIQPNCWQILLMSAVFAIFVYPLLYKLGKAGRANEKIRDYVPMTIGLILIGTEIYKQILMLYHFNWKYHFYLFPFQLCSVPMYTAALIPVIKNQKLKDSLFSFMAVYGMIGGLSVMIYQKSVLTWEDYSLNWHSIFWHLSLIALGIFSASYLRIGSGSFNRNAKILSYGSIVFVICVILAEIMNFMIVMNKGYNEYTSGGNLFYISMFMYNLDIPILKIVISHCGWYIGLIGYTSVLLLGGLVLSLLYMGFNRLNKAITNKFQLKSIKTNN